MGRLVVLIVLIVLAVWLVRRAIHGKRSGSAGVPKNQDLVRCAHCGVHLPRAEARAASGVLYCSEEHARLGPAKR
ncbi:MAG: hypothetical protein M3544_05405 [Pseudomonadota bacterium]|nr:hypothetical protein [Pseudomonadota bacterium]